MCKRDKLTEVELRALGVPPCSKCGRYNTDGMECTALSACERRVSSLEQAYVENDLHPPFTVFVLRGEIGELPGFGVIGSWNAGYGRTEEGLSALGRKQVRDTLEGMRQMFAPPVPGALTDDTHRDWCEVRLHALRERVDAALAALQEGDDARALYAHARSLTRAAAEYVDILDAYEWMQTRDLAGLSR